jgi:hypothetical protein
VSFSFVVRIPMGNPESPGQHCHISRPGPDRHAASLLPVGCTNLHQSGHLVIKIRSESLKRTPDIPASGFYKWWKVLRPPNTPRGAKAKPGKQLFSLDFANGKMLAFAGHWTHGKIRRIGLWLSNGVPLLSATRMCLSHASHAPFNSRLEDYRSSL